MKNKKSRLMVPGYSDQFPAIGRQVDNIGANILPPMNLKNMVSSISTPSLCILTKDNQSPQRGRLIGFNQKPLSFPLSNFQRIRICFDRYIMSKLGEALIKTVGKASAIRKTKGKTGCSDNCNCKRYPHRPGIRGYLPAGCQKACKRTAPAYCRKGHRSTMKTVKPSPPSSVVAHADMNIELDF